MCLCIYLPRFLFVSPGKLALISEKKISCSANLWVLDGVECSVVMDSSTGQECCGEAEIWAGCVKQRSEHLQTRSGISVSTFPMKITRITMSFPGVYGFDALEENIRPWCSGDNFGKLWNWNHTVLQMTLVFLGFFWKSPQAVLFTSLFLCSGCIHCSCWVWLCWAAVGDPAACQTPQRSVGMQSKWVQLITAFGQLIGYQAFEGSNALASSPTLLFEQSVARSKSD